MPDTLRQFKASIFQALAHPTRIAIIEVLRDGELSAGAIIERLAIDQSNASQHLSILRARQIVTSRKEGNQVFYTVRDPLLIEVLDVMRRYFQAHVEGPCLCSSKLTCLIRMSPRSECLCHHCFNQNISLKEKDKRKLDGSHNREETEKMTMAEMKKRVLLIGEKADNELFALLGEEGYEVAALETPDRARGVCPLYKPHLIIVQLRYPKDVAILDECLAIAGRVPVVAVISLIAKPDSG